MTDTPYSFLLSIEVGFGTRLVLIFSRAQGLYGHDLIKPIRIELSKTILSKEELAKDLDWGLSQVRELWGSWSTPERDGNSEVQEAYDQLAHRAKQSSGRLAALKMKKFGMRIQADQIRLTRFQREGSGWGGVRVEQIEVGDFPKITPAAMKKLATKCAAIAFPYLDGAPPLPAAKPAKRRKA